MKDRIEELAQQIYMDESGMPSMELRCKVITTAVNEALELAAMECEKKQLCGNWAMEGLDNHSKITGWHEHTTTKDCAAAIRKLKVR